MKINAINNQSGELTIDPGASGDSFIQFDINGTGEFRIGVDDTDDSFRISQGSALGTIDTFIMTASGENTWPLQPAFLAQQASGFDTDVTGNGTVFTLGSGLALTKRFDQGGDITTAGVFTAPITGIYFLGSSMLLAQAPATPMTATSMNYTIVTSNRTWSGYKINPSTTYNLGQQIGVSFSTLMDMDSGDTATTQIALSGSGADTSDVVGTGGVDCRTQFNGRLVA